MKNLPCIYSFIYGTYIEELDWSWGVDRGMLKGPSIRFGSRFLTPSTPIWVGDFRTESMFLMLSMSLKYKITDIRPEHEKNLFYFLVPQSSTDTGLNCVKKLGDEYLKLEPFKCALIQYIYVVQKHVPGLLLAGDGKLLCQPHHLLLLEQEVQSFIIRNSNKN